MNRKDLYTAASIRVREKMSRSIIKKNINVKDEAIKFLKLTQTIPNWKSYLTEKQLEVVDYYLQVLNTSEVDSRFNLTEGTTYHRLFGTPSTNHRGAYGKLLEVSKNIKNNKKKKTL
jgi:hypothetical protein